MIKNIGPLEDKILEILWDKKQATARDISNSLEEIGERRAYSTVRTIIKRLVDKKIIAERTDNDERTFIYIPLLSKEELEKTIVGSILGELLTRFNQSTISYLAEGLSDNEKEIKKIKKKLNEMKRNG
ncbi:MAG: BlaI/MecI/CopY family transcriptional regulator [Candidatus Thermoplasmatota archaeon]|nr:BlaI/MecI/CopY family transcriptional regulator [Candidatus Thermoplasmatota archaeon]